MGSMLNIPVLSSSFVSLRMIGLIISLKVTGRSELYLNSGFILSRDTMFRMDSSITHYFDNAVGVFHM